MKEVASDHRLGNFFFVQPPVRGEEALSLSIFKLKPSVDTFFLMAIWSTVLLLPLCNAFHRILMEDGNARYHVPLHRGPPRVRRMLNEDDTNFALDFETVPLARGTG